MHVLPTLPSPTRTVLTRRDVSGAAPPPSPLGGMMALGLGGGGEGGGAQQLGEEREREV